jgi:hypothetical protein
MISRSNWIHCHPIIEAVHDDVAEELGENRQLELLSFRGQTIYAEGG